MLPIAVACRWSLLLLSRLLSAQALYDGYLLPLETARTLQGMTRVRPGRLLPGPWSLTGGGAETPLGFDCQGALATVTRCDQAFASS